MQHQGSHREARSHRHGHAHGEAQGCGKYGCKWVGVHELPSPAQGQSGCRDRGPDSGPAGPEPEKEERTP